jgi:hypothetical protein
MSRVAHRMRGGPYGIRTCMCLTTIHLQILDATFALCFRCFTVQMSVGISSEWTADHGELAAWLLTNQIACRQAEVQRAGGRYSIGYGRGLACVSLHCLSQRSLRLRFPLAHRKVCDAQ